MVNPYLSPSSDSQGIPQKASGPRSFTQRATFVIALAGIVGSVLGSIMILLSQSAVGRVRDAQQMMWDSTIPVFVLSLLVLAISFATRRRANETST